jgi:L-threonylcarbamoyladenylate synthase
MFNQKIPAIFLDRDGTLIEDKGVITSPEQIHLFDDTVESLLMLQQKYKLFVVTNQPGISQKKVSFEQVEILNQHINEILKNQGIHIEKWYVCPHERKENCKCIKPNPTFLLQATQEFNISLSHSVFIGDHPHDVTTGEAVGAFGIYLLTGHGHKHLDELPVEKLVFHNLSEATKWILEHPNHELDFYKSIQAGANAIKEGGLVVFPTETVYGIGADAFNPKAVVNIFSVKKRPLHDPLIVHISDKSQVYSLVNQLPKQAELLMEHFWPGPLTLVLPKSDIVPDIVTAGLSTVAVRMPQSPWSQELIRLAGTPIAAPSANSFGSTSPTTAGHVRDQLSKGYKVLINGGTCRVGIESTVVSFINNRIEILRPGGISKESIESFIGSIHETSTKHNFASPGMMSKHYAPSTPFVLSENIDSYSDTKNVGLILFQNTPKNFQGVVKYLSFDGDDKEAAANLYGTIRNLDKMGLSCIIAQMVPNEGLGVAINDRLKRASSQSI